MVDGRAEKKGPGSRSWGPKRAGTEARSLGPPAAGLWEARSSRAGVLALRPLKGSSPSPLLIWQEGLAKATAPAFLQGCPSRSCHSLLLSFPCRSRCPAEVTPTEFLSPRPAVLSPPLSFSLGLSSLSPKVAHPLSQICALLLPTFLLVSHHSFGHIYGLDFCLSSTM